MSSAVLCCDEHDAVRAPGIAGLVWQAAQAQIGQQGIVVEGQGQRHVKGGSRGLGAARQVRGHVDVAYTQVEKEEVDTRGEKSGM